MESRDMGAGVSEPGLQGRSDKILLVDDEPDILRVVSAKLRGAGYVVETVASGEEACEKMRQWPPDVVLLDVAMPGQSGLEVCRWIRQDPGLRYVYVIMLTAKAQVDDRVTGLDCGADDYITKPFELTELLARMRAGNRRYREQCALQEQAIHDGLTGLYGKQVFWTFLEKEFHRAERYGYSLAVVVVDLDRLKAINDLHGHLAGDAALQAVAEVLRASRRQSDIAVRFGGDEFVLLLPQTAMDGAAIVAERVRRAVESERITHGDAVLRITASIGAAATDVSGHTTPETLFELADAAARDAKQGGRNTVCLAAAEAEVRGGGGIGNETAL